MKKRLLSLILVLALVLAFSLSAFATDTGIDIIDDPLSYYFENQMLGVQKGTGVTLVCPKCDYKVVYTGGTLVTCPHDGEALVLSDLAGVHAEKFQSGGGSTDGSGVGRRPDGYADDKGSALVDKDGWPTATYTMLLDGYDTSAGCNTVNVHNSSNKSNPNSWFAYTNGSYTCSDGSVDVYGFYGDSNNRTVSAAVSYYLIAPDTGYYTINVNPATFSCSVKDSSGSYYTKYSNDSYVQSFAAFLDCVAIKTPQTDWNSIVWVNNSKGRNPLTWCYQSSSRYAKKGDLLFFVYNACFSTAIGPIYPYKQLSIKTTTPTLTFKGSSSTQIVNNNSITINNNTWNGNIYTDNSTNLTYIYPQYTTINEKNETVTNISNTPIIYNNETKKYYTYDTVTNNYYYITYEQPATPTPSPSPTPAPTEKPGGSISTPETGKPGGDTGDTTGILAVLVEIRDNMIQGFLDIKAAFVAGFAELSANFTLAIENLNVNIQNVFNKKFPDQSTPETAQPTPTPSPEPTETPSPTEPPSPTPSPSPAPTGKPDGGGDTNNFWNIFIGGGSDDGTDGDHKGIFWALISLILALIAFFTNLFAGVAYLFPFLPEGVVMTINTCLFVVFLFVIIKFIMRSK